jgi:hypothetical protein
MIQFSLDQMPSYGGKAAFVLVLVLVIVIVIDPAGSEKAITNHDYGSDYDNEHDNEHGNYDISAPPVTLIAWPVI